MSKKDERRDALLRFIRRRSGRRFTVAVMAREFGVSERTIQDDLSLWKYSGRSGEHRVIIRCTDKTEILSFIRAAASGNLINRTTDRKDGRRPV